MQPPEEHTPHPRQTEGIPEYHRRYKGDNRPPGTYSINHGVLAFIDDKNHMHIAYADSRNVKMLEDAGYKHGSFSVPNLEGTDDEVRKWLAKMREISADMDATKLPHPAIPSYEKHLRYSGLRIPDALAGTYTTTRERDLPQEPGHDIAWMEVRPSPGVSPGERYLCIAPYTLEAEKKLQEAGYQLGGWRIPYYDEGYNQWSETRQKIENTIQGEETSA